MRKILFITALLLLTVSVIHAAPSEPPKYSATLEDLQEPKRVFQDEMIPDSAEHEEWIEGYYEMEPLGKYALIDEKACYNGAVKDAVSKACTMISSKTVVNDGQVVDDTITTKTEVLILKQDRTGDYNTYFYKLSKGRKVICTKVRLLIYTKPYYIKEKIYEETYVSDPGYRSFLIDNKSGEVISHN